MSKDTGRWHIDMGPDFKHINRLGCPCHLVESSTDQSKLTPDLVSVEGEIDTKSDVAGDGRYPPHDNPVTDDLLRIIDTERSRYKVAVAITDYITAATQSAEARGRLEQAKHSIEIAMARMRYPQPPTPKNDPWYNGWQLAVGETTEVLRDEYLSLQPPPLAEDSTAK